MKKLLVFVSAFGLGLAALGAPKGSHEGAAAPIRVGGSVSVTLVGEYDPEDGSTSDSYGVYYLEVTLTRGQSYTLSYTGGNADDVSVSAYPRDETDSEFDRDIYAPMAGFDTDAHQGSVHVSWLYSSDWDEEDPTSWQYFICIDGEIGQTTTVTLQQGIKTFIPEGYEDNPKPITFSDTEKTLSNLKITEEDSYYLTATLKGGRKYLIRTTGGTAELPLRLQVSSEDNYVEEDDPEFAADANNKALALYPEAGGSYTFEVYGAPTNTPFGLVYRSVPVRPIGDHPVTDLAFDEPQVFVPGAENATLEFYDNIIDAALFRVSAANGDRLVFDATGANRRLTMRLYDARGNVLAENQTIGDGSLDTRIGYTATAAGVYYVGVCDNLLAPGEAKVCSATTILARKAGNEDGEDVAISPRPGKATDNPVTAGAVSGPYKLGFDCWSQTFVIGARKDITYVLATSFAGDTSNLGLKAEVFTKSGSSEQKLTLDGDEITPGMALSFTAKANKAYYVRISVAEGKSLEFPEFNVHALAYSESGELGILTVKTYGAPGATWYLDNESSYPYPGGTSILVDNSVTRTVTFKAVANFKLPDPSVIKGITILPGMTPTEVEGYYTDKADPADATTPVSWTLKNTPTSFDRTLWATDEADKFAIAAKAGYFYDFALSDVTGDAVFGIVDDAGNEIVKGATSVSKLELPVGKCVLTVGHGQSPAGKGSYTISGKFANVGTVKLAKTAVSVKEDAANVTLSVSRTAKDGRVRVKYGTVAGSAFPGVDYVAQSGVLEWADGDSKAKTVTVKLIPDLVPTYEGANKQFEIKFEPIPEDDLEDDEYAAVFVEDKWTKGALDTVTVTLTEATRASAGTVQVVCTTPKKPVYEVKAGEKLSFELERRDAADGAIEVKVDASAIGGGVQTVEWGDGESGKKQVEIGVPANEQDYKTTKKGTVRLAATSTAKPKFTASSITVTVVNEKFEMTAAEWAKTSEGKTCGYALREEKSGTWFKTGEDTFTNLTGMGALTITVTGPCVFEYSVDGITQEPVEVELGKTKAVVIPSGSHRVVFDYKYNNGDYDTVFQGVKYGYETAVAGPEAQTVKVMQGKLPDGVKLEKDREDDCWYVRGVPTKAGYFYAVITDATTPGNPIELTRVILRVNEIGTAVGTFNGVLGVDGPALTNAFPSLGTVQLTVTTAGKLTAKVAVGGKSYSFSGTGFDEVEEDADIEGAHRLSATLTLAQKIAGEEYAAELVLNVLDAKADDLAALGSVFGTVNLTMAIPDSDNKGAQPDIAYMADLFRDNTKNADYVLSFAAFTGYYTVALPILCPEEGKPQGNGYLTVTVDDKGKAKVAGKLADGMAVSSALVPALIGDLTVPRTCELVIPVYLAKKPCVFGGVLHIRVAEDGTAVVDSTIPLRWANDNALLTYYGEEGWDYELSPCGGWYDTVYNLQAFFRDNSFAFDAGYSDELPEEIAKGYDFVSSTMPTGNAVDLQGNNLVADKQKLVKDTETKLYDFDRCVNPSGVKVSFKRATGVVSGTFNVWTEGADARGKTVQKSVAGFKHEGILLLSRDEAAPLDIQVWTAGYFLAPSVTSEETGRKYTESRQFNILAEDQSGEDPWADDWGWNPEWGDEPAE